MNPSTNEQAGLKLPAPVIERQAPTSVMPEASNKVPETAPLAAEGSLPTGQIQPPITPPIAVNVNDQSSATVSQVDVSSTTQTVTPLTADDGDLIEKEWVNRAKKIVDETREDPAKQSKEINIFKSEYMQKRYNKTIKISE